MGSRGDPLCSGRFPVARVLYDTRLTDLEQWLRLPKGVTAMICWLGVAMAWLCCENVSQFENGDEVRRTTASRRLDWHIVHQDVDWIGKGQRL